MDTLTYMITDYWILILVGLLFIGLGLAIPKYKLYWLIAGLNGLTKKELEKFDLRYIEKYFGRSFFVLGLAVVVIVFFGTLLELTDFIWPTFATVVLLTVIILVIYGASRKSKIYKSGVD